MGVAYHWSFFSFINKGAYLFGAVFVVQALLLAYYGLIKQRLSFQFTRDVYGLTGLVFVLFALAVYPALGYYSGHIYPSSPTFGLPCPTTIFTFGIFLWSDRKIPLAVFVIPLLWSIIGFSAAFLLGIKEDIGLLVAGLTGSVMIVLRNSKWQ